MTPNCSDSRLNLARRPQIKALQRVTVDAEALGASCQSCPLQKLGALPCQPPEKSGHSKLLIVQDYPHTYEDKAGKQVTTSYSRFLERNLTAANADVVDYTWALLCRPPKGTDKKDVEKAIECCRPRLAKEIEQSHPPMDAGQPKWLLSLGKEAFAATTGKMGSEEPWIGTPVDTLWGGKAIPQFSVDYMLGPDGRRFGKVFFKHLERAWLFASGQLLPFKWPDIIVDDNAVMAEALEQIWDAAISGTAIGVDIETDGKIEEGKVPAISCISLAIQDIAVCIQLPASEKTLRRFKDILQVAYTIMQNGRAFDEFVLRYHGFPTHGKWDDTMLMAAVLDPALPKNLGFLGSSEFHAEAFKADYKADKNTGVMAGNWTSKDPEEQRKRRRYCAKDAYTTLMLARRQFVRLGQVSP